MASTRRARNRTQQIWGRFCAMFEQNVTLDGREPAFKRDFLILFGKLTREGLVSKSGKSVRAHTVEVALGDVGALFTELGQPDPRLADGQRHYVGPLKSWLVALHKEDPASTTVMPCSLAIIQELYRTEPRTSLERHTRDLITVAFFFLNRPGEILHTNATDSGRSAPFRLEDVSFLRPVSRSDRLCAVRSLGYGILNDVKRQRHRAANLTYTDQKNCRKGEHVAHGLSGDDHVCPVRALERIVARLLEAGAPLDAPLCRHYTGKKGRNKYKTVTSAMATTMLRKAAAAVQDLTGISPARISARSLRPGGATALLCAGQSPDTISLVGRWRSEAVLRYLRAQATPVAQKFASLMLNHGTFTYLHQLSAVPEFPGVPTNAPVLLREKFDPSDDASDLESDDGSVGDLPDAAAIEAFGRR